MFSQIGQLAIAAENLDRAVAFYRDTLGLRLLFQAPPGLAFFDCGGIRLMISAVVEQQGAPKLTSMIYYKVDDIQRVFDTLSERGVSIESKPHAIAKMPDHDLWMGFFRDSEGNLVGVMSEVR